MTEEKKSTAVTAQVAMENLRTTINSLSKEFSAALPPQIPVEKFIRTVITTIQMNPDLLQCDRKSLLATCMKAAQDGLLLDGREAAPVIFNTKTGKKCQYIPMVAGILKKMRQSGEIVSAAAHVVYSGDLFHYELGDDEKIVHKPILGGGEERGDIIAVYAIVRTTDGGVYREVMPRADIEKVRMTSKARSEDSPWNTWYEEMAKKTVLKRIAKRTPSSTDLEQVIDHDNEVVGFVQHRGEQATVAATNEPAPTHRPSYLSAVAEEGKDEEENSG